MRIHKRALLKLAALCVPLAASQAAAVGLGAAESPARHATIPEFSIVVSTSGNENEIVATCTGACAWKRVSARYPEGAYHITQRGIAMVNPAGRSSADPAPTSGFSVVVNTVDGGITAACDRGCAWKTVGARYPGGAYRITEKGIGPAGMAASR
jgi:hypothetical protein